MMSKPLVSILMPVYNASKYLGTCLDSILNQSYNSWELLAVDDFSTDTSLAILSEYSRLDSRISVYQNAEKGIIPALTMAFSQSKGSYVTRMDADDIMPMHKIAHLLNLLVKYGPGNLATGLVSYFSDNELREGYLKYAEWLNGLTINANNFEDIYKECVIPSPCWMLSREDLLNCGAFDSGLYPEDYDLCFRFRRAGYKIRPVKNICHLWRDHTTRASRNDDNYADNRFLDLKMKYFLEDDFKIDKELVLWGAGKKGKQLAKKFIERDLTFHWISNNPKKAGHNIYGVEIKLEQSFEFPKRAQVVFAIAEKKDSLLRESKIENLIKKNRTIEIFRFC